jgi:hypothetical protein
MRTDSDAFEVEFAAALGAGPRQYPAGAPDALDSKTLCRLDIYKNNVIGSLINALSIRYPVVNRLVGDRFFRAMCGRFVQAFPPRSPVLIAYGRAIPRFIENFEPASSLPYLADVARLESAVWAAYHAADIASVPPQAFADVNPKLARRVRLRFTPSTSVVLSRWPVVSIWDANTHDTEVAPVALDAAQCALVTRSKLDVRVTPLNSTLAHFVEKIAAGATLELAIRSALQVEPGFRISKGLSLLATSGIVSGIEVMSPGSSPKRGRRSRPCDAH